MDLSNKIYVYTNSVEKFKKIKLNLKFDVKKIYDDNINDRLNDSIIILLEENQNINKLNKLKNTILISNLDKKNNKYIYFNDFEELELILKILSNQKAKIGILLYLSDITKNIQLCIDSVINQTYKNFNLFICVGKNDEPIIQVLDLYKSDNKVKIIINSLPTSKFFAFNQIIDTIGVDFFILLEPTDILDKNRLLFDMINYESIIKNNKNVNIFGIQSGSNLIKNKNDKEKISTVERIITWKIDVIKKIGYFCNNKFLSDVEYYYRTNKILGTNSIVKYNSITSNIIYDKKINNYDENTKLLFVGKIMKLLKNKNNYNIFFNKEMDYFYDLARILPDNNVNLKDYRLFYKDLNNLNDDELNTHWEKIGRIEGRLPNLNLFVEKFPNFDFNSYIKNNFEGIIFSCKHEIYGWIYLRNKKEYFKWLKNNNFIDKNSKKIKKNDNNQEKKYLKEFLITNNIRYYYVSNMSKLDIDIEKEYNISKYNCLTDKFDNVIFFGIYTEDDYSKITYHIGKKYILWLGSYSNSDYKQTLKIFDRIKYYLNIAHLAINDEIYNTLEESGIIPVKIELKNYISNVYNDKIIKSNTENNKKKIFNFIDIHEKIKIFDEVKEYDFYNDDICEDKLNNIYKNIDNFIKLFEGYEKILFICGDYPGYGGAATNCDKIQDFFIENGFKTFAIYFNYNGEKNKAVDSNNKYKIINEKNLKNELEKMSFKPDIIILKNSINNFNIKSIFKCPIIFLIPGIFKNNLDKYYYELTKNEYDNYINYNTIKQIEQSDISFCNSLHTKEILLKNYNLKTYLFYSSFVSFYGQQIDKDDKWDLRKYDYGLIVSNFDRKIKNIEKSIEFLKDKTNVILIGINSSRYQKYGFKCLELVDNEKMNWYYKQIKYIVQDSFYESCSNVKIESFFNGCEIYSSKECELIKYIINKNEIINSIKKNIYMICFNNWDSCKLRGKYIAENSFISNYYNVIYIDITNKSVYDIFKKIYNSIIVFIKGDFKIIYKIIDILRNNNNILIHDIIDLYNQNNIINIKKEKIFDYVFCNSLHMKNILVEYGININKIILLYHPCDKNLNTSNIIKEEIIYIGHLDKCDLNIEEYGIKHIPFKYELDRCIQFTYVTNKIFYNFHTSTKLATAIKTRSIFISNKIPIFVELLGVNYPFFIDNINMLTKTFNNALKILIDKNKYNNFYNKYYKKLEKILIDNSLEYVTIFNNILKKNENFRNNICIYKSYFIEKNNDNEKFNYLENINYYDYYIFTNSERDHIDFLPYTKIHVKFNDNNIFNNRILSRLFKWFGYMYFKDYKFYIYLDSYFHIKINNENNYKSIFNKLNLNSNIFYLVDKHKCRNNILDEINHNINYWSNLKLIKEKKSNLVKLKEHLLNFEKKKLDIILENKLTQNGVIFIKNKKLSIYFINNMIRYFIKYTYRDQCILNIVNYKSNIVSFYENMQTLFDIDKNNNNHEYKYIITN